jgi:hypothetical protein
MLSTSTVLALWGTLICLCAASPVPRPRVQLDSVKRAFEKRSEAGPENGGANFPGSLPPNRRPNLARDQLTPSIQIHPSSRLATPGTPSPLAQREAASTSQFFHRPTTTPGPPSTTQMVRKKMRCPTCRLGWMPPVPTPGRQISSKEVTAHS